MEPNNVIMILLDGVRLDMLNSHPVFATLKTRGEFYNNIQTYAPYTTASMHAILTGIYGSRNGVNSYYSASKYKRKDCLSLPEYFSNSKHATFLDINNKNTIPYYGYNSLNEYDEYSDSCRYNLWQRHTKLLDSRLDSKKKNFIALHNLKTHTELILKFKNKYAGVNEEKYYENVDQNTIEYREYVNHIGEYVENMFSYLYSRDFFKDGLLVIFSDHGCSLGERSGEKMYGTYLEDYTTKTFMYLIGENVVEPNRVDSAFYRSVDIMPTLLELCSLKVSERHFPLDGISMFKKAQRLGFSETAPLAGSSPSPYYPNYHSITNEDYKLLFHSTNGDLQFLKKKDSSWTMIEPSGDTCKYFLSELCKISPITNRFYLSRYFN